MAKVEKRTVTIDSALVDASTVETLLHVPEFLSRGGAVTLKELQDAAHAIAKAKGWHDNDEPENPQWIVACLALIGCEVSECIEAVRDGDIAVSFREDKYGNMKPEGLGIELADVVLRVLDLAEAMDINLDACIRTKMDFNRTRKHRHGGRAL